MVATFVPLAEQRDGVVQPQSVDLRHRRLPHPGLHHSPDMQEMHCRTAVFDKPQGSDQRQVVLLCAEIADAHDALAGPAGQCGPPPKRFRFRFGDEVRQILHAFLAEPQPLDRPASQTFAHGEDVPEPPGGAPVWGTRPRDVIVFSVVVVPHHPRG